MTSFQGLVILESIMDDIRHLKIKLTPEEKAVLHGAKGPTMQKILRTVVLYGETLDAERLVEIEVDGYLVGLVVADIWTGKRIYTIDQLGDEFLECVKNGDTIRIDADRTVAVLRPEFSS